MWPRPRRRTAWFRVRACLFSVCPCACATGSRVFFPCVSVRALRPASVSRASGSPPPVFETPNRKGCGFHSRGLVPLRVAEFVINSSCFGALHHQAGSSGFKRRDAVSEPPSTGGKLILADFLPSFLGYSRLPLYLSIVESTKYALHSFCFVFLNR